MTGRYTLPDAAATAALGRRLSAILRPGDVILLYGDLGAGKTVFTKAIACGLGIDEQEVTSPSFTLVHEHQGRIPLIHADLYRLGPDADVSEIGLEEHLRGEGVVVIEWAENLGASIPDEALEVKLDMIDRDRREATLRPRGEQWARRLEQWGREPFDNAQKSR